MKKSAGHAPPVTTNSKKVPDTQPSALRQLRIGQALLETTWRIVVPVVLCTGLGIYADLHLGTKPWLTLLGVLIGFVLAGLLIARLLKESENE